MQEHGLVEADEVDGKKQFRLTAAGRERLTAYRSAQGDDVVEPWNDTARGPRGDLRGHVAELVGQVRQVGRFGTPEQIAQAATVLTDAKRRLYAILATESPEVDPQGDAQDDPAR